MTLEENKQVVQRFHEQVWNQGNLAVIDELVSSDYRMHKPLPSPDREGLRQFVAMIHSAFPDWHETIEDVIAEEDRVVLRGIIRGTQRGAYLGMPPTGQQIQMPSIFIFRLVDGKIVEDWGEADTLGMMQQLGALPHMGAQ
jgi:steroid delta-isomerase-like uncharacterized protein